MMIISIKKRLKKYSATLKGVSHVTHSTQHGYHPRADCHIAVLLTFNRKTCIKKKKKKNKTKQNNANIIYI